MEIINLAKHFKIPVNNSIISNTNNKLICMYLQVITKRISLMLQDPLLRTTNSIITLIVALRTERNLNKSGQTSQLQYHKILTRVAFSHHISPKIYTPQNKDSILMRTDIIRYIQGNNNHNNKINLIDVYLFLFNISYLFLLFMCFISEKVHFTASLSFLFYTHKI